MPLPWDKNKTQLIMTRYFFKPLLLIIFCFGLCPMLSAQKNKAKIGIIGDVAKSEMFYAAGYRYMEEGVSRSFSPRNVSDSAFQVRLKLIQSSKVKVVAANVFLPGVLRLVGDDINEAAVLGYVDTVMKRSKAAGLKIIVLGSGGSRNLTEGYDKEKAKLQFINIVRKMSAVAAKYDMIIAMENLNRGECNFVNNLTESLEIANAINHPNFKLTADIYHMLRENDPPSSIIAAGKYLVHCHIAENKDRAYPGKNGEDFKPYFRALKQIGFKGVITMECGWTKIEEEAPVALKYLQGQLDEVYREK
jgi:sugar phosphate isomerase/epimerase